MFKLNERYLGTPATLYVLKYSGFLGWIGFKHSIVVLNDGSIIEKILTGPQQVSRYSIKSEHKIRWIKLVRKIKSNTIKRMQGTVQNIEFESTYNPFTSNCHDFCAQVFNLGSPYFLKG